MRSIFKVTQYRDVNGRGAGPDFGRIEGVAGLWLLASFRKLLTPLQYVMQCHWNSEISPEEFRFYLSTLDLVDINFLRILISYA